MRKSIPALLALVLVISGLGTMASLTGISLEAEAVGAAVVDVKFDESSVIADVSPGSNAIVHLTGTVTCQTPYPNQVQSVQVTLRPECAWPPGVAPSSMTFTSTNMDRAQSFDLSVL